MLCFHRNGHEVLCSKKVKNLGAILDQDMSMFSFVSNLCKNLYFQVRKISSIRKYINHNVAKALVTTLILSRIDYCNSLLAGLPKQQLQRLQNLQNNAARLITSKRKRDHVTPMLIELHWLNINDRICYKICLFCFKCLNNMAPEYLTGMLRVYTPSRSLRSANDRTILVKPHKNYVAYGKRSFSYVAPTMWNRLPRYTRESDSIETFKRQLKHHLFTTTYSRQ